MAAPRHPRPQLPPQARKRISAVRLSVDSTGSLPAYSLPPKSPSNWPNNDNQPIDDQPPDYPQSAEEADQEDDFVPLRGPRSTAPRRLRHRRSESYAGSAPASPSVDDLLERSVVALELSTNALMQSMNTQSTLSTIANDQILERSLDRQTRMLDMRIRGNRSTHEGWMDDLDEVMRGVDGLLAEGDDNAGVSRSLPTTSDMPRPRPRHRPSINLAKPNSDSPFLHLSTSSELDLRETVRPPRALTQYVSVESSLGEACEATADPGSIFLPSTNGLRSAAQIRRFSGSGGVEPRPRRLRQSMSAPGPDWNHSAPSTPAYNMLSHLARRSSRSPSLTRTVSPPPAPSQSSTTSESTPRRKLRRHSGSSVDSNFTFTTSLRRSRSNSQGRSSISAETPPLPPVRAMTPPMEEITPSSSSDSSSSPRKVNAFRTMQSLRKILDDAPPDPKGKRSTALEARALRRTFQPRTPSVTASAGTSTATASVSRLLTRSSHHASHLPRQSSLKQSHSVPQTPSIPGTPNLSAPVSRLSSTPSTPRQVSFAELPASYSGRPRRKAKDKGKGKGKAKRDKDQEDGRWWSVWFTGSGSGIAAARHDERMEDRLLRGWGRPGASGGGSDEWMM